MNKKYLGNGIHAEINGECQVALTKKGNMICLDPDTWEALVIYIEEAVGGDLGEIVQFKSAAARLTDPDKET